MKIEVLTNLPAESFDFKLLSTVLDNFQIELIHDNFIETYRNSSNVFFKMPHEGGQTLINALNALHRSLMNIDHAKEFFIHGNT